MEARDPHSIFRGTGVPGRRTSQCKGSEVAEASRCSSKRKLSAAFIQLQSRGWTYREGGGEGGIKVVRLGSPPVAVLFSHVWKRSQPRAVTQCESTFQNQVQSPPPTSVSCSGASRDSSHQPKPSPLATHHMDGLFSSRLSSTICQAQP